ncbi:MAG: NADH-quinone oxidoreductase subunit NuoG [Acidimicrobiia bacterium]
MTMHDAPVSTTVKLTIDGKEVEAAPGTLLIKAAQDAGIFIPRFCWHERMTPVGMCRMCLVEIEGVRGLPPACTTPVADGMVVHLQQENVEKAQDGVLEFLLINHPLDCPVCDRGGECPLQDQTLAFGPGESRFVEEKRHFEKPIPISDLVMLDRERCIQCARCTRFADEIAGDPLITFVERGGHTQVLTFPDDPFVSYFSGNTVQICPVGALTAKPYRFKARPWDLQTSETSCQTCAVNCRGAVQSTTNEVVRFLGVDSEPVNHGWLCDKGRFGYEYLRAPERISEPMLRDGDGWKSVSWPEAFDAAAAGLQRAIELHGPQSVAVLGGARGNNESAYTLARFTRAVLGTDNIDAQLGDGLPAEAVLGLPGAAIADLDSAAAIVLCGPDLKEELPVLALRVRRAAEELGVPLIDLGARDTGLTRSAHAVIRTAPGALGTVGEQLAAAIGGTRSGDAEIDAAATLLEGRSGNIVMVLGRPSLAESVDGALAAASAFHALGRTTFLSALRRGNVRGALECGCAPGVLPGRVSLEAGRTHFSAAWGTLPSARGLDARGILEAARDGRVHALVLVGADPLADFPDRTLAREALDAVGFVVALDAFQSDSLRRADVLLPTAMWSERAGTTTNLEGRVQRLAARVTAPGVAMDDWRILGELALRFGHDFDFATIEEIQTELAQCAPAFAGATPALLARAQDGVRLPVADYRDDIVFTSGVGFVPEFSWEPIRPGTNFDGVVPATDLEDQPVSAPNVAMIKWSDVAANTSVPPADAYALRLISGRSLYDTGRITASGASIAGLAPGARLQINPTDAARLGVSDGDTVRVASPQTALTLPIALDPATVAGTAFMFFTPGGIGAADLIDCAAPVTELRIETVRA